MRTRLLVVGYGNELRGDDAAGPHVARTVAGWGWPGVTGLTLHQLVPELSEPLAQADLVVFVDAAVNCDSVRWTHLGEKTRSSIGHVIDPETILELARVLHGRRPRAWLVRVPAVCLDFGVGLSSRARAGAAQAERLIAEWAGRLSRVTCCPGSAE
jgi:hydrogenase maturation protease